MSYYRICPDCGSHLDPGERCDCQDEENAAPVLEHQSGKADLSSDKYPLPILLMNLEEVKS